jgi:hypothetical protein
MLREIQQNKERRSIPETTNTFDNNAPIKLETWRQNVRRQDTHIDIFTSRGKRNIGRPRNRYWEQPNF